MYQQIDRMSDDGTITNYAGIIRGNVQRAIKLELAQKDSDEIQSDIDQMIEILMGNNQSIKLKGVNELAFQSKVKEVKEAWDKLKNTLQVFRENPQTLPELLQKSEEYWEISRQITDTAEEIAKNHVKTTKLIKISIFILNIIVLFIIWRITENIASKLKKSLKTLATSSTEISATIEQQEEAINQQAASVNQTTTTMDELSASSRQSIEQATVAANAAQQVLRLTEKGNESVQETLMGMEDLKEKVAAIAEQTVRLSGQTHQIGNISQVVTELANQTNMLALNAAVEAVKAGEEGKGFSIVASEIRKLADESKKSADQINNLVSEIQNAINITVMVTDEGNKTVKTEMEIAQETAEIFADMEEAINYVVINNQQISLNIQQQDKAIQQVLEAMNNINRAAKETATGINQTKMGTRYLNQASQDLKGLVEK
ncbi:methyl-accepting chemotaxis protein [Rippkaea orientalis]|nr:methyl-accepting chemotaxis protein [Rippkaea orientalis]